MTRSVLALCRNCQRSESLQNQNADDFTEGFDTRDLKEAKALLAELA
jgi:hypothetical protein